MYKHCDSKGYTYNMRVYLGEERKCATGTVTTSHVTMTRIVG